jgi:hypothetical protein
MITDFNLGNIFPFFLLTHTFHSLYILSIRVQGVPSTDGTKDLPDFFMENVPMLKPFSICACLLICQANALANLAIHAPAPHTPEFDTTAHAWAQDLCRFTHNTSSSDLQRKTMLNNETPSPITKCNATYQSHLDSLIPYRHKVTESDLRENSFPYPIHQAHTGLHPIGQEKLVTPGLMQVEITEQISHDPSLQNHDDIQTKGALPLIPTPLACTLLLGGFVSLTLRTLIDKRQNQ